MEPHALLQKHKRKCCSSRSFGGHSRSSPLVCLGRAPALLPLMSAARSQLSKDFDERGGSERVRGERGLEKAQKKIPQQTPFSRVRSLPNLSQPPLILQSPFLIFCPPLPSVFICCLSSSPSLRPSSLSTHCTKSEQPATHSGCN